MQSSHNCVAWNAPQVSKKATQNISASSKIFTAPKTFICLRQPGHWQHLDMYWCSSVDAHPQVWSVYAIFIEQKRKERDKDYPLTTYEKELCPSSIVLHKQPFLSSLNLANREKQFLH